MYSLISGMNGIEINLAVIAYVWSSAKALCSHKNLYKMDKGFTKKLEFDYSCLIPPLPIDPCMVHPGREDNLWYPRRLLKAFPHSKTNKA